MNTMPTNVAETLLRSENPRSLYIVMDKAFVDWALSKNTHNRPIRHEYVKRLIEKINRGEWKTIHQGISFSKGGWLLDGQHRLIACKNTNYPPLVFNVSFGIDDDAQINIDDNTNRSPADRISIATGESMHNSKAAIFTWMVRLDKRYYISKKVTSDEYLEAHKKYKEDVDILWAKTQSGRCFGAPFFAPMVYLHKRGVSKAELLLFRNQCMYGEELKKGSPVLAWRYKVVEQYQRPGHYQLFASTVTALKAFLEKRNLKIIKVFGEETREQTEAFRNYIEWLDDIAAKMNGRFTGLKNGYWFSNGRIVKCEASNP